MGTTARKKAIFENLLRLRRAGRASPDSLDIAAVQAFLEDELGDTVSRRLAAQLLGVSHTALARWISRGDLPVVPAATGRTEIPVAALLELREAVDKERLTGRRQLHVIEPKMRAAHERAAKIRPNELVIGTDGGEGHRRAELRSLAYHRAVAKHLGRADVADARQLISKWRTQGRIDPRYAAQWERLLVRPLPQIKRALAEDTQEMRDLRQNSPFAGVLSEAERERILASVR